MLTNLHAILDIHVLQHLHPLVSDSTDIFNQTHDTYSTVHRATASLLSTGGRFVITAQFIQSMYRYMNAGNTVSTSIYQYFLLIIVVDAWME